MLKYLKRQTSRRRNSHESLGDDVGNNKVVAVAGVGAGVGSGSAVEKRDSLRSTTSFCDEVFLEELTQTSAAAAAVEDETTSLDVSCHSDAISCGAGSLSNGFVGIAADGNEIFYHSRLSMSLSSIVNEPNCLCYFVQYLETKNALALIKFYLNIENFKRAALTQLDKHVVKNYENTEEQHYEELEVEKEISLTSEEIKANDDKNITLKNKIRTCLVENKDETTNDNDNDSVNVNVIDESSSKSKPKVTNDKEEECNKVPELKSICDLSMRKPLTDDEKSQIYAETNKQLKKCNSNQQLHQQHLQEQHKPAKASSELSICSAVSSSLDVGNQQGCAISAASIKDAIAIYQKYLIGNAPQFVELPIAILAPISLMLCGSASSSSSGAGASAAAASDAATSDEIDSKPILASCFDEARDYVLQQMEQKYVNEFLQSSYYCKYCVELIDGHDDAGLRPLTIYDILYSEVTLFYFMEYLEQHGERECLDFWSAAINFRKGFTTPQETKQELNAIKCNNDTEAQADAMIIYERFFSLQSDCRLWMSDKLRSHVEQSICAPGQVAFAFDLPLQVTAKYLEQKYFQNFLKSQLFDTYLNELKMKIQKSAAQMEQNKAKNVTIEAIPSLHKLSLRRNNPNKKSVATHRKTMSDCTHISQHNTLLAAMDTTKATNMNIDARQLTNPNLLWQRSNAPQSCNGTGGGGIIFGRVNSLGRYERDFEAVDAAMLKQNWSLSGSGNKIKNAMRKLVNLPEDKVQEEIAWQVAEMIVKDVTSVTLKGQNSSQHK